MDEKLKKEVESLLKQGYDEPQIKEALTGKGYALNDINEAISKSFAIPEKKGNSKAIFIGGIIFGIALIVGLTYFFWPKPSVPVNAQPFSNYPGDWIESNTNTIVDINVSKATDYMSEFNYGRQTFVDADGSIYAVFMNPYFEGESVKYVFENTGKIQMISGDNFNLSDDIPQGFALMKREDNDFVIYLFIDQDFKSKLNDDVYLVWSNDISNSSLINERQFDFSKTENGIYFDKIKDASWITKNPIRGRLYLGNLRKQDLIDGKFNKTFFEIY